MVPVCLKGWTDTFLDGHCIFTYLLAAPSRDLDLRQQLPSLDESFAEPKYRTPSPANFLGEFYLFIYCNQLI